MAFRLAFASLALPIRTVQWILIILSSRDSPTGNASLARSMQNHNSASISIENDCPASSHQDYSSCRWLDSANMHVRQPFTVSERWQNSPLFRIAIVLLDNKPGYAYCSPQTTSIDSLYAYTVLSQHALLLQELHNCSLSETFLTLSRSGSAALRQHETSPLPSPFTHYEARDASLHSPQWSLLL